jgi:hypothetical protein
MEQKIEKLPDSLVNKLKELQKEGNDAVTTLGKINIDIHLHTNEIERLEILKKETLEMYGKVVDNINSELKVLGEAYPNGEINLEDGSVIYF